MLREGDGKGAREKNIEGIGRRGERGKDRAGGGKTSPAASNRKGKTLRRARTGFRGYRGYRSLSSAAKTTTTTTKKTATVGFEGRSNSVREGGAGGEERENYSSEKCVP